MGNDRVACRGKIRRNSPLNLTLSRGLFFDVFTDCPLRTLCLNIRGFSGVLGTTPSLANFVVLSPDLQPCLRHSVEGQSCQLITTEGVGSVGQEDYLLNPNRQRG